MNLDKRIDKILTHKVWLAISGVERATNENNKLVTVIPQNILIEHHNDMKLAIKQLIEEESLENIINQALPDLREIVWHSDGRVIAKTGNNAKYPKKLYGNGIRSALAKIIADKENR